MNQHHIKFIASILATTILTACVTATGPMREDDRARLKSAPVVHAVYHGPWKPMILKSGTAAFGVFGAAGGAVAGLITAAGDGTLSKSHGITEPALTLREAFLDAAPNHSMAPSALVRHDAAISVSNSADALKESFGKGMVLSFSVITNFLYYPTTWSKYKMQYLGDARLIDLDSGKVLWRGYCEVQQDHGDKAPTLYDLVKDNSALMKIWLLDSARECVQKLVKDFS